MSKVGQSVYLLCHVVVLFTFITRGMSYEDRAASNGAGYAMYVWTDGFDNSLSGQFITLYSSILSLLKCLSVIFK